MCVHLQVVVLLCTLLTVLYRVQWYRISISSPKCPETSLKAAVRWLAQYYLDSLGCFFKRVDRIETIKEPEPVPSTSGVSEIAACPLRPITDNPSALLSPTSSHLQSVTLPACSLDASPCMPVAVLYYHTFQSTIRLKKFFLNFLCFSSVQSLSRVRLFATP